MEHDHTPNSGGFFRSPLGLILIAFLAIAGFFLLAEHRAHILAGNWGTGLLVAAFVGLHFLMHAGHGGHGGQSGRGGHEGHGGCGGGRNSQSRERPRTETQGDKQ